MHGDENFSSEMELKKGVPAAELGAVLKLLFWSFL